MVTVAQPGNTAGTARPTERPTEGDHPSGPVDPSAGLRNWRWEARAHAWTAGSAAILFGLVFAVYASAWLGAARAGTVLLVLASLAGAMGAVLGGLARGAGAAGQRRLGSALLLLAGLWGVGGAWFAASAPAHRLAALATAVAVVLVLAGVSTPLGKSALLGAGAVLVTAVLWECGLLLTDMRRTGVVLGALSVFVLGFVPRLALQGAGVLRLDDQRSRGASVSAHEVDTALAANHRALALVTVTAAASTAVGGWLALSRPSPWSVGLAVLLVLLLLARARAYPLTVGVLALTAAAAVLLVRLVAQWGEGATLGPLVLLLALLCLPLVSIVLRPSHRLREVLRKTADVGESASVLLLIPFVLGAFGVFG